MDKKVNAIMTPKAMLIDMAKSITSKSDVRLKCIRLLVFHESLQSLSISKIIINKLIP